MRTTLVLLISILLGAAACGDGSSSEEGSGSLCGGHSGAGCPDSEFCDYPTALCGAGDASGICRAQPNVCPDNFAPVKGADGETYSNDCNAHAAGVDDCGPSTR